MDIGTQGPSFVAQVMCLSTYICSQCFKLFFAGNLDFPTVMKLKTNLLYDV